MHLRLRFWRSARGGRKTDFVFAESILQSAAAGVGDFFRQLHPVGAYGIWVAETEHIQRGYDGL
jgi:hypothetical protein